MFSPSKWRHGKKLIDLSISFSLDYESSFPPRPHADGLHQSPLHVSARTRSQPWPSSRPVASPQHSTRQCLAQFTAINTALHPKKRGKPKFRTLLMVMCRSRWPRGVRRGSAAFRSLGLRVRIPPSAVCLSVISKPQQRGGLGPLGLWSHKKITVMCLNYTKDIHSQPPLKMSNLIFSLFRKFICRQSQRRSRNHCCNGYATTYSLCTAELHVTVNNTKILIVARKCFYGEFMSPATPQRTLVFT